MKQQILSASYQTQYQPAQQRFAAMERFSMDRASCNIILAIEDAHLLSLVKKHLTAAGFAPREVKYEDVLAMPPAFGPFNEAAFIVYAGQERARMHTLANHLYQEWSLKGSVLYLVFHPGEIVEEDLFKLWRLDALWKYNAEHDFVALHRSYAEDLEEEVRQMAKGLLFMLGEERKKA